ASMKLVLFILLLVLLGCEAKYRYGKREAGFEIVMGESDGILASAAPQARPKRWGDLPIPKKKMVIQHVRACRWGGLPIPE
ncbi:hypothetical protein PMAYCL1PPCAC_22362, partial [Pristionchus mayeri]